MCGRYANSRVAADLSVLFEAVDEAPGLTPDYNLAPTDPAPIVRMSRTGRVLSVARWGLLPPWATDRKAGVRMINARVETVATARAYAGAFAARRCLVPADGWYEWLRRAGAGGRQAYFMTPRDGSGLALAGVWSAWGPDRLLTFSVLTTAAAGDLAAVHDRMPLVLPPSRWASWLAADGADAVPLLAPPSAAVLAGLEIRPVGPAVGDVRNDGPQLTAEVDSLPLSDAAGPGLF